ncbi:MAG: Spy/CpxP family protein refolding chaperone [Zoogloeaceae bacterium]|nr:Spy/CpxP family protein refolding chaperone [Zoogloeaceae bacterium]
MNNMHKIIVAFLATSSIALGVSTVNAEDRDHRKGDSHDGKAWHKDAKEGIAARHERLHKALKLSEAQEPAWKAFIANASPEGWEHHPDPKEFDKLTAPERMEKMLENTRKHQEFMSQRLADLKVFYAQLSPEQQKTFDAQHRGADPRRQGKKRPSH